ncbi:MAG: hypothetical protein UZ21_OP11001000974 [Microgenomates bacterium OLB22]|nr:MAG: hypothetical protein UZ21_OP11001000974 [Microgenomates bacterium OLB22]
MIQSTQLSGLNKEFDLNNTVTSSGNWINKILVEALLRFDFRTDSIKCQPGQRPSEYSFDLDTAALHLLRVRENFEGYHDLDIALWQFMWDSVVHAHKNLASDVREESDLAEYLTHKPYFAYPSPRSRMALRLSVEKYGSRLQNAVTIH